ncbi:MAG: hypothetical protein ACI9T9_002721 [Oleiphilaceae bacterium]|jgi:hypothetical protein
MQKDSFSSPDIKHKGKLICKECKSGNMLPAIQEGEPEYTDNFICENCQHHDTIPTLDILFNQIFTGISGFIFTAYLFTTRLSGLFSGIQHGNMKHALQDASLTALSAAFLLGFLYILYRAHAGIQYRREYTPTKKTSSV